MEYYTLTSKGKSLMSSSKKRIPINALILLGVFFIFVITFIFHNPFIQGGDLTQEYEAMEDSWLYIDDEKLENLPAYDGSEGEYLVITNDNLNQTNSTDSGDQ